MLIIIVQVTLLTCIIEFLMNVVNISLLVCVERQNSHLNNVIIIIILLLAGRPLGSVMEISYTIIL